MPFNELSLSSFDIPDSPGDEARAMLSEGEVDNNFVVKKKLDVSNNQLGNLTAACEKFVTWAGTADATLFSTFDWVTSQMHGINHFVTEALLSGVAKNEIIEALSKVREIQAGSPFVSRLQNWPRGYAGDFETVEYLMAGDNRAEPNSVAYWIERYCLNTAIAQQHRNKVRFQSDQIVQAVNKGNSQGRPAQILILACGSSPDVRLCLDQIKNHEFQMILNDMDDAALEYSADKLNSLGDRIKIIGGNMFRNINKFAAEGQYDLILAGGLFDYLKDDQAVFLIEAVTTKLLSPNGKFVFTNIAKPNPYKIWMEYCANWFLIERGEGDIYQLLADVGVDRESIKLSMDNTGMTGLVEVNAPPHANLENGKAITFTKEVFG